MIAIITALILITVYTREAFANQYYYLTFYFIASGFTSIYYLKFMVGYPSILQPKWKSLMPFDLPKVAATITLTFLAVSFYFTAKEYPTFFIYQNVPYILVLFFLLPISLGVILTLRHLNSLSARTKLKYWRYLRYLKYGLYIHITVTFYVLSLIFLSWDVATNGTRVLCALFGLASFAFYLAFAWDLRTILEDQNIKPTSNSLDISCHITALYSWFFLLFFGFSFIYGKTSGFIGFELTSYPAILVFIAFFLIAFGAYLSVTHKGFEEIMRKNIWSELAYIFAFIVFLLVYLIYSSLSTHLRQFPYHNSVFIGYLAVLIIEILSTRTLAGKFKYTGAGSGEGDIVRLLNSYAHNFLRTDYLEDLWEKTLDRYVLEDEVKKIGFDPAGRRFDLGKANEKTRLNIAVRMLLGMHKISNVEKVTLLRESTEETKEAIVNILKEKILLLPDDLRSEFDERLYYPILYERTINDLLAHLKTFIPLSEQKNILEGLKRRDELFNCIEFEGEEIGIKKGTRFNRDEFLKLFRLYLDAVEDKFPFKRCLLHGMVKEEIKRDMPTITAGDVLDMVSTGLKELDKAMAGGFAKGSSTLLIAEETKAKNKILLSFIKRAMTEETGVIYATSKRPFRQIIGELRMDIKSLKNFVMLDLYENLYAEDSVSELVEEEHRIIVPLNKIFFQRSIVKTIKSHPKEYSKIVIIDVYDELSRYYNPGEIHELLQKQIEGLKRWNCTSVIVLDPHSYLITREGVEEVKRHFDNILLLSGGEKDTSVFIEKLYHGTPSKHVIRLPW